MGLYKYSFQIIIFWFLLKLLIKLINRLTIYIRTNTEKNKSDKGIISIKDLQLKDYDRFLESINFYLYCNFYDNISFKKQVDVYITECTATLNTEPIYIYCIQNEMKSDSEDEDNWTETDISTLKIFVANLLSSGMKKALVINNSSFTNDAIEYMYKVNHSDFKLNVTLMDGYDFTRLLRSYKENPKEEVGEL